ncbi:SycD/LcrH family type III secretion system chaperone BcrH1 [Bordetella bronchiseptica]|uniref:SycD/LcrH family type III secretion system chaperone BcrH1 n=1 Tax=Bordetella bronchiseptica TaxID=518 RepID=UPI0005290306|nr:SycD/LcrH family type III secretion system chaperone BcrH1 [Bordetella bronchiseptica]
MPKSVEQGGSPASASHEALRHILDAGASMGSLQGLDEAQQQALYAIAHGAYEQGRYADALKMFCLLVACDPLEARYLLALGAAAQELGLYEHALQQYAAAAALQLDSPRPLLHGAECLYALGRRRDALDTLDMVLELCGSPEHAALRERAESLRRSYARAD